MIKPMNEESQRWLVTLASIGEGVIVTDAEARVAFLNPIAEALTGWSLDDALSHPSAEVFAIADEESGEPIQSPVARVLETGSFVALADHPVLTARDGTRRPIDASASPIRDGNGGTTGVVLVFRDVTERRALEWKLEQSRRELQDFVENATMGLHWVGPDGTIHWANQAELDLLGYSREEYLGHNITEFHADPPVIQDILDRLTRGEKLQDYEARMRCKDGSIRYVLINSSVLFDEGRFVHTRCFTRDVTEQRQAAEALRESESRLTAIVEQSPLGIGLVDRQGEWVVSNERMRALFPRKIPSRDPERARCWRAWREDGSVLEPEDWPGARALRGEAVSPGIEFLYTTEDGRETWMRVATSPFLDQEGNVTGAICVVQDIHAVKQGEAALRESETRFRTLAETIPQLAWYANADGYITWYNRRWYEYTGTTPEQMEGWGWQRVHDPEVLLQVLERWRRSIATGEPFDMVFPLRGADGVFRPFLTRVMPLKDSAGRVAQWFGTNTDITAQQAIQEATDRRSEQLRRLAEVATRLNAAPDIASAMSLVTEEARTLIGAHQSVVGFTINHNWAQTVNTVSLSEKYAAWRAYDAPPDGTGIYAEVCRRNRPMRLTQAELLAHPLWRGFGRETGKHPPLRGWLAAPLVGRDGRNMGLLQLSDKYEGEFTEDDEAMLVQLAQMASVAVENARLVEDLRAAGKAKDDFLAMLAHELRNPLSPMSTATQILKLRSGGEAVIQQQCEVLERQTRHLSRLLDDLLDVSRITRGKITLERAVFDLREIVRHALETSRGLIEERGHRVQLSQPDAPVKVAGDEVRLEQIVTNLLNNAAKYTDPGGQLWVTLTEQQSEALLSVRDTGQGIAKELLPRIFDLFQQGDRALDRSQGGLGVGLTLVKRLAELHGGSVEVHSDGPGQGTEFLVHLPCVSLLPSPPEAAETELSPGNGSVGVAYHRVMVVDDLVDNRETLAELIRLWGYEVRTAPDGAAALELARTYRPEVVLLDIGMPGMNGYEVATRLRQDPRLQPLYLIALTGYGRSEDVERARAAGFDQHLTKPVDTEGLRQLLSDTFVKSRP